MNSNALALSLAMVLAGCTTAPAPATDPPQGWEVLLSPAFSRVIIESHATEDFASPPGAWSTFLERVESVTMKDVTPEEHELAEWAREPREWTLAELERLVETSGRALPREEIAIGEDVVLQVFFLPGSYDRTLGIAWAHRIFLFQAPGGTLEKVPGVNEEVMSATLVHEFGHTLGLVGCGLPMVQPHEDPESRCHSRNVKSVMSPGIHPENVADPSAPGTLRPNEFDADDLRDIDAARRRLAQG